MRPVVSVLMPVYNGAAYLDSSIGCVVSQTFSNWELIVLDDGSTDDSVEVVSDYCLMLNGRYEVKWVSEKDKGVYNAMNKGIRMATGDFIQILNSGDILAAPDVLSKMSDFVKRYTIHRPEAATPYTENAGIFYGNMIRQRADGTIEGKSGQVPYSLLNYFTSTMNHDCCWMKRSLFEEYGLYDENLKIVSDWKWFLQAIGLGHVKPVYVDIDMTIFDTTGISERNLGLRNEERRKVLEEVLPPAVLADYDKHAFDMHQMDNLRKHPWAYKLVWTLERVLNRLDNKNFRKPKK